MVNLTILLNEISFSVKSQYPHTHILAHLTFRFLYRCGQETRIIPRILQMRSHWLKSERESVRLEEAGVSKEVYNSPSCSICSRARAHTHVRSMTQIRFPSSPHILHSIFISHELRNEHMINMRRAYIFL